MKEKKNIDRIFQEKLKNFEAQPKPNVWEGIQAELQSEKKDRKIIPFWWKLGGIAAALVLMLGIGYGVFNANQSQNNSVLNQNETILDSTKNVPSNPKIQDGELVFENQNSDNNESSIETHRQITNNSTITTNNDLTKDAIKSKIDNKTKRLANESYPEKSNAIAESNQVKDKKLNEEKSSEQASTLINKEIMQDNNADVASEAIEKTNKEKVIELVTKQEDINFKVTGESELTSKIEKEEDIPKETLATEKTIEEAIAEAENIIDGEEKEALNRWRVSPNVAPVYFNSLGEGSSIHSQFNENSKSSDINMSYGISTSYAINKKLRVRTGINAVGFDYRTNGIITSDASARNSNNASNISNIKFNQNVTTTNYLSNRAVSLSSAPDIVKTADLSSLEQQFGFIEVPLELEYSLVDKKVGLNVIGGFSTFFLNNNNIFEIQNGNGTLIGEANNINDVSYSANFGLGVFYNFSKSFQFNLEPIFKYQINTFSNTFGDFQPFFVGVYTGLSFKF
ncbi:hypothetical protein [Paucihalobacter sp.]|uniref:hypothetical protein n=1 Tax=Paucihalobacter sp. TaxID=2850405 RepID=UPI002FE1482A